MKIALAQLEFIHPLLREIVLWVEGEFGEQTVTSLYRIADPGVHGRLPLRGIDLRDVDEQTSKKIQHAVNERWTYDPSRTHIGCCLYHNNRGGSGKHLHFQVHPNTIRKE